MTKVNNEEAFEVPIEDHLLANGYRTVHYTTYNADRALLVDELIGFIEVTQPKPWAKLANIHGAKLRTMFLEWLSKDIGQRGLLRVLRQGTSFYGEDRTRLLSTCVRAEPRDARTRSESAMEFS